MNIDVNLMRFPSLVLVFPLKPEETDTASVQTPNEFRTSGRLEKIYTTRGCARRGERTGKPQCMHPHKRVCVTTAPQDAATDVAPQPLVSSSVLWPRSHGQVLRPALTTSVRSLQIRRPRLLHATVPARPPRA